MCAQEVATVAQALAALRVKPSDAYASALFAAAARQLPAFTPDGLGMLAYAAALLNAPPPPGWRAAFVAAAGRALPRCSAHNLACLSMLLARWLHDPGPAWWTAFFQAGEQLMAADAFTAQVGRFAHALAPSAFHNVHLGTGVGAPAIHTSRMLGAPPSSSPLRAWASLPAAS